MKKINIMTSSDVNLLRYIAVQLQSISDNVTNREIHFYLFHAGIARQEISKLQKQCQEYSHFHFHDIVIEREDDYVKLAKYGGGWAGAAYYSLLAHQYLPENMDRILYIDAGDVFFNGQPDDYYDIKFKDRALAVTIARFKQAGNDFALFGGDDLFNMELLPGILRGLFNSGSYVINLKKMREIGYTMDDYLALAEALSRAVDKEEGVYWGDQGLLSAAFVGNLVGFRYPAVKNVWYMPNNFCMWYFDSWNVKPDYHPNIVHFAGAAKPWKVRYPISLDLLSNTQDSEKTNIDSLRIGQAEYYYLWHEYAIKTEHLLKSLDIHW